MELDSVVCKNGSEDDLKDLKPPVRTYARAMRTRTPRIIRIKVFMASSKALRFIVYFVQQICAVPSASLAPDIAGLPGGQPVTGGLAPGAKVTTDPPNCSQVCF